MPGENAAATDAPGAGVDWDALRAAARAAAGDAYVPYSHLRVGAAGVTAAGELISGCNVENASFGLTLCAECGLVSALARTTARRLVAVSVVAGDGAPLTPCGRCRQLLFEHGGPGLLLDGGEGAVPLRLDDLLPGAFGPAALEERREVPLEGRAGEGA